jgi:hypothetical protein
MKYRHLHPAAYYRRLCVVAGIATGILCDCSHDLNANKAPAVVSIDCNAYLGDRFVVNSAIVKPTAPQAVAHALSPRSLYLLSWRVVRGTVLTQDVLRPGSWYVRDAFSKRTYEVRLGPHGINPAPPVVGEGTHVAIFLRQDLDGTTALTFFRDSIWAVVNRRLVDINPSVRAERAGYLSVPLKSLCSNFVFRPRARNRTLRDAALVDAGILTPAQRSFYNRLLQSSPELLLWWFQYKEAGAKFPFPIAYCDAHHRTSCLSRRALIKALKITFTL